MNLAHSVRERTTYDLLSVGVSVFLALVGSFAALVSAIRIPYVPGPMRRRWVAASAVSLGGGAIWSMHFIGMIGYHVGSREIVYDLPLTAPAPGRTVAR
jgi:NO-binding membrane sensor protein with MHYT domain